MITHRVLPPEEWSLLIAREPFATGGLPNPDLWRIVVVERDGEIVGHCCVFDSPHWDVWNIDPEEQGNPVVFKELVAGGIEVLDEYGIDFVHTTVPNGPGHEIVCNMLERFGFSPAEGRLYYFQRERG